MIVGHRFNYEPDLPVKKRGVDDALYASDVKRRDSESELDDSTFLGYGS